MKETTPFNPVLLPNLNLPITDQKPEKPVAAITKASRRKGVSRKTTRTAKKRRVLEVPHSAVRFTVKIRRQARRLSQRIKGGLNARLAHLDHAQLKKVLLGCGIAAAAVVAVVTLVKLTPLIITMLAVLGLGAVLQAWDRLRVMRPA